MTMKSHLQATAAARLSSVPPLYLSGVLPPVQGLGPRVYLLRIIQAANGLSPPSRPYCPVW
jgi:hypothetical protein